MEENKVTIDMALEVTADILRSIPVPVSLMQTIAVPISNAVKNLEECVTAMRNASKQEPEAVEDAE